MELYTFGSHLDPVVRHYRPIRDVLVPVNAICRGFFSLISRPHYDASLDNGVPFRAEW